MDRVPACQPKGRWLTPVQGTFWVAARSPVGGAREATILMFLSLSPSLPSLKTNKQTNIYTTTTTTTKLLHWTRQPSPPSSLRCGWSKSLYAVARHPFTALRCPLLYALQSTDLFFMRWTFKPFPAFTDGCLEQSWAYLFHVCESFSAVHTRESKG